MYRPMGLSTTGAEQSGSPGHYEVVQNVRLGRGVFDVRKGMKKLATIAPTSDSAVLDLDGVDDFVTTTADSTIHNLQARAAWTIEGLCRAGGITSERPIFFISGVIKVYQDNTSGGRVVAEVIDSAAATTTLIVTGIVATDNVAWQVACSGASLTLRANGGSATGTLAGGTLATVAANLLHGKRTGPNTFYLGAIEFNRGFNVAKTSQEYGWSRLVNPYAPDVLWDYVFEIDTGTGFVLDRSRYENHSDITGTPATTTTLCGNPPAPIQSMAPMLDKKGARRVLITARGGTYSGLLG